VGSGAVVNAVLGGAQLPWVETSAFVLAMVSGMIVGRQISRYLQSWQIQRGFAVLLFCVSCFMLTKAFLSLES
jgi:uncharacterized membrane protein YfcA